MIYQSSNTSKFYDIVFDKKRIKCPECSASRTKEKNKDLVYFADTNRAYCHHCNTTFFEYKPYEKKEYVAPERKNNTKLTDKAVKYFADRGIPQEVLNAAGVYSDTEWMPQFEKEVEVICFPFYVGDELVNIKYRGANKAFKLHSGAKTVWYNYNSIPENDEIVVVEGEIDCLSMMACGVGNCVSVPNGAKNTSFIDESIELFSGKTIVLAVDNDSNGIELRDELIRRFGSENCKSVSFKECKDANEYLLKYGQTNLADAVANAVHLRVDGNISVDSFRSDIEDLFENGLQRGALLYQDGIDQYTSWETGRLAIVTGRPGSGKSEFVDYIISRLNAIHGWKSSIFTPENIPLKIHYAKIFEKLIGKKFGRKDASQVEFDMAIEYIKDNFFYILPEEDMTVDKILANAKAWVRSKGIKVLVIDPYNKLDHQISRNQTETQYVSMFLDKLIMFAQLNDVLVILVAHPVKLDRETIPTLYNISGSSHFYNKADYGLTVHREFNESNLMTTNVEVHWQKIKFKHLGEQGVSELSYDYITGRYVRRGSAFDHTNWLTDPIREVYVDSSDDLFDPF